MGNSIKIFKKEEFGSIRVTEMDGEPMFCLSDVAKALEYARPADAVTTHCKGVVILPTPTSGGVQPIKYGKESEVYRLIMKSNAKKAEAFQDWVCSDVLPSIRKTGTYSLPQFAVPKTFAEALQLAADQAKQIEEQERQLAAAKPKVLFADTVSCSTNSILVGELAKLMAQKGVKIGQNRLFEWLRSNGYICTRNGNKNYPTQRSIEQKLLEVIERTVTKPDGSALSTFTTKVTGKGQVFFVNKFLEQVP
jgi:anti-repressor protein